MRQVVFVTPWQLQGFVQWKSVGSSVVGQGSEGKSCACAWWDFYVKDISKVQSTGKKREWVCWVTAYKHTSARKSNLNCQEQIWFLFPSPHQNNSVVKWLPVDRHFVKSSSSTYRFGLVWQQTWSEWTEVSLERDDRDFPHVIEHRFELSVCEW